MRQSIKNEKRLWKSKVFALSILVFQMSLAEQVLASGKDYMQYCMSCHADDGSGEMPGVPDLTLNKQWMNLTESELFNKLDKGFQTPGSVMPMPARGGATDLTDKELLETIRYLRKVILIDR